jgi:hypothetical protein
MNIDLIWAFLMTPLWILLTVAGLRSLWELIKKPATDVGCCLAGCLWPVYFILTLLTFTAWSKVLH